ncbi:MAG TPA: PQQ-dependent dehydrogenase, methanol/ethanol family [Kofleriaceae bacterium]|jgi:PQQ-dependent dehydrogenase (methanol/ethanol family)|nr:PQQ-dependent dehydrogenase, methanol/ethanol family [Kofleriaceae bacterium]
MGRRDHALILALALGTACQGDSRAGTATGRSAIEARGRLVMVSDGDDGQWTMAAKDFANTRYTALDQITPDNAAELSVAWTYDTGSTNGHEGAPLVVGGVMYLVTPFPNRLVALDLARHGAVRWEYAVPHDEAARGVACCDTVNRGAAFADGKLYFATLDDHLVAVDAASGRGVFDTKLGDISQGETITMAPIIAGRNVLVGNSGGELGVRGWLTAVDATTGAIAWRAYSTGPDSDCRIGPGFHPFYAMDRGKDLGVTTWPAGKWRNGGGTVWGWLSYDPESDLVYYGTANPGPWNADMRPGDNKWTSGIFARKPKTGEAVWFYQWSPHDLWDHDGVNESILLDLEQGSARRKVLVHPERNGYVYVLDRLTGEVLSADPFVHITTSRGVDLKTGRLAHNPDKVPTPGRVMRDVCPFAPGAKDWEPSAFSPKTGLLYLPHITMCMDEEYTETSYIAGTPFVGANVRYYAMAGGKRGAFTAWDPIARRAAWSIPEDFPVWSGALATGGGVVFYGTMDGVFKAVDATTGRLVWSVRLPSGVIGQPISYRGPDGKQYVAVFSGVGGWAGSIVSLGLDPRDLSAANGWGNAMQDLSSRTQRGGRLYVFAR